MPTPTYDLLASNVLTSSASSVTFSSIPATYRDLVLVFLPITASQSFLEFNDSAVSGSYVGVQMTGNGSSAASEGFSSTAMELRLGSSTTTPALYRVSIFDYSATDKHKTSLVRVDRADSATHAQAHRWANTSAINKIDIFTLGSYDSGSSFYLYGIAS